MALSRISNQLNHPAQRGFYWGLKGFLAIIAIVALALIHPTPVFGQEQGVGKLGAIIGKATIIRDGQNIPAKKGMAVFPSDVLKTEAKAVVKIQFDDGGSFMAFEDSSVKIEEYDVKRQGEQVSLKSAFNIAKGKVRFFVKPGENRKNDATYKTKNAVMGIRGTSGFIDTTGGKTQLVVTTGKVEVSNPKIPGQAVLVPANFMTDVVGDSAPAVPKQAPADLLQGLKASASSADSSASVEQSETKSEQDSKSEQGSKSEQDSKSEQGSKSEQDSKSEQGSKSEQDSKSEPGTKSEQDSKSDSGSKPSSDGSQNKPAEQGNNQSESQSEGKATADSPAGNSDSSGPSERAASSQGDSRKSDEGLARQNQEKAGASPAPASNRAGEPASEQNSPKIRRVTVFSEDGSASVAVSDKSAANFSATVDSNVAPIPARAGAQSGNGVAASGSAGSAQKEAVKAASQQTVSQVQTATQAAKAVQTNISNSVEQAIETSAATDTAKQAVSAPTSRSVKVKVVLPGQ